MYLNILFFCFDFSYFTISLYFFLLNILGCALVCAFSKDPVFVLLHFLCIFLLSTFTLLFFNIEFLVFVFLLVYLGAIMIFFLFVVNFINLRYEVGFFCITEKKKFLIWEILCAFILVNFLKIYYFGFLSQLQYENNFYFLKKDYTGTTFDYAIFFIDDFYKLSCSKSILNEENILLFLNLYNTHFFLLLLLALILFIVLVGSIFICEVNKNINLKNFLIR